MIAVIFYLASIGAVIAIAMTIPILIAFGHQESDIGLRMFAYVVGLGFISISIILSIHGRNHSLTRLGSYFLCLIAWVLFPTIVSVAVRDFLDTSLIAALFEVFSAFTTNSASAIGNLDSTPKSVIAFLALLQWLGGLGTLLTVSTVLAPSAIGGLREESQSTIGHSLVTSSFRLHEFSRNLLQIYLILTANCYTFLLLSGIQPYDAFVLCMSAISTGGILPNSQSVDIVAGTGGMIIMALFFAIGATSIFWHRMVVSWQVENLKKHRESYFWIAIWFILALAFTSVILSVSGSNEGEIGFQPLAEGLFNSASILSTSGLQSRPGVFNLLPAIVVLAMIFIGGGSFSSSGGIKMFRIGTMISQSVHELNRLVYPNIVRPAHFGSQYFDVQLMKSIWSLFITAVIVVFVGAILLASTGMNFQAAYTAAVTNFATAGPAYGPEWSTGSTEGWPDYFEMQPSAHIILIVLMLAGRLELVALLAVFNWSYWRER